MAVEKIRSAFRMFFSRNDTRTEPSPAEDPQYPGLEKYPEQLKLLQDIGVTVDEIAQVYRVFGKYYGSDFDKYGHEFADYSTPHLDKVIFPHQDTYPYILSVNRSDMYTVGAYQSLPSRRICMNIFPDRSLSLLFQTPTLDHRSDSASLFLNPLGKPQWGDRAIKGGVHLNSEVPAAGIRPLSHIQNQEVEGTICDFSSGYLRENWGLELNEFDGPTDKLAREIILAEGDSRLDMKNILEQVRL